MRMETDWLINQCARSGSCRGSELNSTRALTLTCNSTAVSLVVYVCIHYKLFACENKPVRIYKGHVPVSIRRHKDVDIICDLAID